MSSSRPGAATWSQSFTAALGSARAALVRRDVLRTRIELAGSEFADEVRAQMVERWRNTKVKCQKARNCTITVDIIPDGLTERN